MLLGHCGYFDGGDVENFLHMLCGGTLIWIINLWFFKNHTDFFDIFRKHSVAKD
jgi:hypothetical protein